MAYVEDHARNLSPRRKAKGIERSVDRAVAEVAAHQRAERRMSQQSTDAWVLVGRTVGGPNAGQPRYHLEDAPIGPASTPDIEKAKLFTSREEACQSAGFTHWSSNMSPMRLADARAALVAA